MRAGADLRGMVTCLVAIAYVGAVPAEVMSVQCTVDRFRSSFASRPDLFVIQFDMDAGRVITYYGAMNLKVRKKEILGVASVDGGWQTSLAIDRNIGRFTSVVDKMERGKYLYADLRGWCVLPPSLRGANYIELTPR
jgi:hypothetical protein